jgi:hypothetical protein
MVLNGKAVVVLAVKNVGESIHLQQNLVLWRAAGKPGY